jgi:hypothetical protein
VNLATPRVFAIFLFLGTSIACLMLWMTWRLFLYVQNPLLSYDEVLTSALVGAVGTSLLWVLPGQLLAAVLAALSFSKFKRVPLWFVLAVLIPVCGLIATSRDIADRYDTIQGNDYRKLLYWLLVVTPGELLSARVAKKFVPQAAQGLQGDGGI